ncbi:nucleotidyltransferase domain-containing protein [Ensifer adhaerens]|uniref:nucleotidyltransferase domain-containing protein n=1 Tax=Ensifer adhaerens TaxID=106592 RepID=UPI001CBC7F85|nr:nucleotidyltransferase domain-containing protein [Ensifer adhaerens]MBZ7927081.1 nucleotidyltransferase domain-containing protein [Ensifer adhaerens]
MGRLEGDYEEGVMSAADVARHLLKTCGSLRDFQSYMFGSSLFGIGSDYDILIVGPSGEPLSRLKAEIGIAGEELPLDVLYMLPSEAEKTGFVVNEGCVTLSQVADCEQSEPVANDKGV